MSEPSIKKRYDAIDGLRAFSAIGIVLMHIQVNGHYKINGFVGTSLIPSFTKLVFLFMIISGFAMCCGYFDKVINNKISPGEFYGRRYAKILPFFALLCILDLIISPSKGAFCEAFADLTLCFGLLPDPNMSVIGVGWFLGVVFVFYLVFPFFCYLISDKRRAWFAFAAAFVFNILCSVYFRVGRTNFIYCAVFFLAGGLIFVYREQLERISEKYRWLVLSACIVCCAAYFIIGDYVPIMIIVFSLFLIYALGPNRKILQNPVTKFLSGISMEIYLCHMVIFRVIEKVHCTHLFSSDVLSYIFTAAATIIGAVLFSVLAKKGLDIAGNTIKNIAGKHKNKQMINNNI